VKPGPAVACVTVRERVPATNGPGPPLPECQDLGVVGCHRMVYLDERMARQGQANTEVRLLSRDRLLVETADLTKRRHSGDHDPAEAVHMLHAPSRPAPFHRAKPIIDRHFRCAL